MLDIGCWMFDVFPRPASSRLDQSRPRIPPLARPSSPRLVGFRISALLRPSVFGFRISLLLSSSSPCLPLPLPAAPAATNEVRLLTLDPGHFHAGLVQKFMYPQVSPVVHVYAPAGPDLEEHLKRIEGFNTRADQPTHWEEKVYTGPDFLQRMLREKAGNVVVLAGNNAHKTEYIYRSVSAGFNVLADKPMAITPADFKLLRKAFTRAAANKVLLYDIMTERYEITSILQRELARMPELFGTLQTGHPEQPAVVMESVHHFFKEVAGKPLTRPAWFYDVRQQGESVPDVGTHLVDGVQWICFPDQALDWRKDIKVSQRPPLVHQADPGAVQALHRPGPLPGFLQEGHRPRRRPRSLCQRRGQLHLARRSREGRRPVAIRGPAGHGRHPLRAGARHPRQPRHQAGRRAELQTRPLRREHGRHTRAQFEETLRAAVAKLNATWPGLDVKPAGAAWEIVIPDKYRVGHEQHFAQVTENFLRFLAEGNMPDWEVPNMLAKYYTTTEAYRLSHRQP